MSSLCSPARQGRSLLLLCILLFGISALTPSHSVSASTLEIHLPKHLRSTAGIGLHTFSAEQLRPHYQTKDGTNTTAGAVDTTDTSTTAPQYFESCWAILSVFDGLILLLALNIMLILGNLSELGLVTCMICIASCIANGLCFYAYYEDKIHSKHELMVAAGFADIFWGIQELGLPTYSYIILRKVLQGKQRQFHAFGFWLCFIAGVAFRLAILGERNIYLDYDNSPSRQMAINHMHNGYFACIAAMELLNGIYLIRSFAPSKNAVTNSTDLFKSIARSSEVRLAFLCLTGIGRSICYAFQTTSQSASNTAGQWDRFFVCIENFFPVVFIVDLLTAKLASLGKRGSLVTTAQSFVDATKAGNANNTTASGRHSGPLLHRKSTPSNNNNDFQPANNSSSGGKVIDGDAIAIDMSRSSLQQTPVRGTLRKPLAPSPIGSPSVGLPPASPVMPSSSPAATAASAATSPRRPISFHFHVHDNLNKDIMNQFAEIIQSVNGTATAEPVASSNPTSAFPSSNAQTTTPSASPAMAMMMSNSSPVTTTPPSSSNAISPRAVDQAS